MGEVREGGREEGREGERDREREGDSGGGKEGERGRLTKHDNIKFIDPLLAHLVEPCLVAQQSVLEASEQTNSIHNKNVSTLNMTERWKSSIVQKLHCLLVKGALG